MRSFFFPKLAFQNIGKNKRFYIPYLITCVFSITMLYDLLFIAGNKGITNIHGGDTLAPMLFMGCWIVAIFSAIFLFYTNSFLIKHRKKEIGLYNILGMSKSNIAHLLIWETLITAVITMIIGILLGILFSKLMLLLLCNMLNFDIQLGFSVSFKSVQITITAFAIIFLVTLIYNLACIRLAKPVELLKGGNVGEKEPKAKWIMAVLGAIALGSAYYIALTTDDAITAIPLFFTAVLLVIFGTYALFISGSIAILKILRSRKSYYYKTNHFTSISGMIYRMKQNAAGLASICILATMVLVMVSGTVCLNLGSQDIINKRNSREISFSSNMEAEPKTDKSELKKCITNSVADNNLKISDLHEIEYLDTTVSRNKNSFQFNNNYSVNGISGITAVCLITEEQYNSATGKNFELSDNEMIARFLNVDEKYDEFEFAGDKYNVKWVEDLSAPDVFSAFMTDSICIAVNENVFNKLNTLQQQTYGESSGDVTWEISFNIDGTSEEKLDCYAKIKQDIEKNTPYNYRGDSKEENRGVFYGLYGGLFFIGIFLGTLFLGFTTLIIYYKQISEGYDDKQRFEIMQKVGMSKAEVKRSINSQVLKVFFLPLIAAIIHLGFAFRIISKLLFLLGLCNTALFVYCTIGTVIVFALIYFLIYYFTAKSYFKIVNA